ncbi:MAG: transcriptional regulator [Gammaproteobacteria bacterium]|nr:transcriptional regulator [Gammaproteobacteria bacterium]
MEPFDPLDILLRLDWTECDDLEFKSARGGLPRSLWETYSALANSYGGVILLGVEDDGTLSGVKEAAKLKRDFWNTLNNRGKVNLNLLTDADVVTVKQADVTLLAIRVPRATRCQRPVFIGQNPLTGTYRRNYEGDYHCTEQETGRMLSDRAEDPADSRILEYYTLADIDLPSLHQYRNRFASFKPTHPWIGEDDQGFLSKLGGWRKDRAAGVEGVTVAGLMMFGRDETLREGLPKYHVDYREKLSDDPAVRWTDRLIPDGTWAGNLFQFYFRVIQRLSVDLKVPFQLDAGLFRKDETIVHEAIREALVNALIHADYQGMGGVVVEKYQDRFELSNPGTLLVSVDQLFNGNVSECRNNTLQTMFMMLGAGEKAGSGIDKIRLGWESQHWRLPKVTEQMQPDRVVWMLPMVSLIPDESLQRLKQQFGADFEQFSSLEIQALVSAEIESRLDNSRMRQITGLHGADVTRLFQALVARRLLVKEGHGRWSWYHLPEIANRTNAAVDSPDNGACSPGNANYPVHNEDHSVHNEVHCVHNEAYCVHKEAHCVHKEVHCVHNEAHSVLMEKIARDQWRRLREMASPAQHARRLKPKQMERLIFQLCQGRWLTKRELGELLNRNIDSLRSRYLTSMVAHNLLRLRFPDKPNRTDQAYRSL